MEGITEEGSPVQIGSPRFGAVKDRPLESPCVRYGGLVAKEVGPDEALLREATAAILSVGPIDFHERRRGGVVNWSYLERRLRGCRKALVSSLAAVDQVLPKVSGRVKGQMNLL